MPIKIIITKPPEEKTLHTGVPVNVAHRVGHAIAQTTLQHRVVAGLVVIGVWVILEYVLKMEAAAHGVEVFGVVPVAERIFSSVFKSVE